MFVDFCRLLNKSEYYLVFKKMYARHIFQIRGVDPGVGGRGPPPPPPHENIGGQTYRFAHPPPPPIISTTWKIRNM